MARLPAAKRDRFLAALPELLHRGSVENRGVDCYRLRYRVRDADGRVKARSLALGKDPALAQGIESLLYQLRESKKLQQHENRLAPLMQHTRLARIRKAFMAVAPGGDHNRRKLWAQYAATFDGLSEASAVGSAIFVAEHLSPPARGRPWFKRWWPQNQLPAGKLSELAGLLSSLPTAP